MVDRFERNLWERVVRLCRFSSPVSRRRDGHPIGSVGGIYGGQEEESYEEEDGQEGDQEEGRQEEEGYQEEGYQEEGRQEEDHKKEDVTGGVPRGRRRLRGNNKQEAVGCGRPLLLFCAAAEA